MVNIRTYGTGSTTLKGPRTGELHDMQAGDDRFEGVNGADSVMGGAGNDRLQGFGGNDWLGGDAGSDEMSGGDGNDIMFGGGGGDRVRADAGADLIYGDMAFTANNRVTTTTPQTFDGKFTLVGTQGSGNDDLDGGAGNDSILGEGGNDDLDGGGDDDLLLGGDGADAVAGGTENDVLFGDGAVSTTPSTGSRSFTVNGTTYYVTDAGTGGNDTMDGGKGNDVLYGGAGVDEITGGVNDTTASFSNGTAVIGTDAPFNETDADGVPLFTIVDEVTGVTLKNAMLDGTHNWLVGADLEAKPPSSDPFTGLPTGPYTYEDGSEFIEENMGAEDGLMFSAAKNESVVITANAPVTKGFEGFDVALFGLEENETLNWTAYGPDGTTVYASGTLQGEDLGVPLLSQTFAGNANLQKLVLKPGAGSDFGVELLSFHYGTAKIPTGGDELWGGSGGDFFGLGEGVQRIMDWEAGDKIALPAFDEAPTILRQVDAAIKAQGGETPAGVLLLGGATVLYDAKGHTWDRSDFVSADHAAIDWSLV